MFGAILGDIIGSPYEFDRGDKTKVFPLISKESHFTDDTVLTVAVASALLDVNENDSDDRIKKRVSDAIKAWGKMFPDSGYGTRFFKWLFADHDEPYGSCGNGSAMRVSPAGWLYGDISTTRRIARLTSEVTHNHPDGVNAAEAVASAIFLARIGEDKNYIKDYIQENFGYDLERKLDDIRPSYHHVELATESVPEAIIAFLEADSFEDAVRNAVSIGGDTDTTAAIAGSIAEAYFGVPEWLKRVAMAKVPMKINNIISSFSFRVSHNRWDDAANGKLDSVICR